MKLFELFGEKAEKFKNIDVTGVTCDSRKVERGNVFVCIEGTTQDGHDFAKKAFECGAAVIIASKDTGLQNQILVDDTREEYAKLCSSWFGNPSNDIKIIGVTGTNGKTSVSYMLKSIIESNGYKVGLIGTIQNMIDREVFPTKNTTPGAYEINSMLSLMKNAGCKYCVMEVSSHALDQKRVHGIDFEAAIFTNLTQDHLDYHKTMENYLQAKSRLFAMCRKAIVNFDDPYTPKIIEGHNCEVKSFSILSNESTYSAKNIVYRSDGVDFEFVGYGIIGRIKISTGGKFTVYNVMCAVSCALELGFSLSSVIKSLSNQTGIRGRAEVVPCDKDFTVIIDYAHTPDGLENILNTFSECEKNRLVVLFGCGGDRDAGKRAKMGEIATRLADFVVITSDNPRTEDPMKIIEDILVGIKDTKTDYKVIPNRIEAIKYVVHNAQKNDIIILAGKGHETYQILHDGTIHLDEREVVAEALSEI